MPPKSCKKRRKREVDEFTKKQANGKASSDNSSLDYQIAEPSEIKHEMDSPFTHQDSSDSEFDFDVSVNSGYLHDKIGIYVKDDTGSSQDKSQLVKMLPADFGVVIVSYTDEERYDNMPGFSCSLRLSIRDKDTILRWLKLFEQKTYTVYRVDSTFKCEKSKKLVFKKNFRCQNNQYNHPNRNKENTRKKRVEHTACPAKISLTIKNHGMQRTTDTYLKEYPAVINIRFTHNHKFRTERDVQKIFRPKTVIQLPDEKKQIEDFKVIVENNLIVNSLNLKEIDESKQVDSVNKEISDDALEEKKNVIMNSDWNDIICDDVFIERSNHSLCLENESESPNYENTLLEIDKLCNSLKTKLITKPDLYNLPLVNFMKAINMMKSDVDIAMALNSFGLYSETEVSCKKEAFMNGQTTNLPNIQAITDTQTKIFTSSYKMEKDDRIFIAATEHPFYRL